MKIKIKYFSKDYPRLEKIAKGDFIDLRVNSIKEFTRTRYIIEGEEVRKQTKTITHNKWFGNTFEYKKGDIIKFGLGVAMELPEGYEAEIRPRSSTFKEYGLMQTNSVGTIDNSYKGDKDEWMVEFIAMRDGVINRFDRVCQFRIWENQPRFEFEEVGRLGNEDRGGYGSTGRN